MSRVASCPPVADGPGAQAHRLARGLGGGLLRDGAGPSARLWKEAVGNQPSRWELPAFFFFFFFFLGGGGGAGSFFFFFVFFFFCFFFLGGGDVFFFWGGEGGGSGDLF